MKDTILITSDFSNDPKDVFGKLEIAPTVKAQKLWEVWKKNPTIFTIAPGYIVIKEEDGIVLESELVELSLVIKQNGRKDESNISK